MFVSTEYIHVFVAHSSSCPLHTTTKPPAHCIVVNHKHVGGKNSHSLSYVLLIFPSHEDLYIHIVTIGLITQATDTLVKNEISMLHVADVTAKHLFIYRGLMLLVSVPGMSAWHSMDGNTSNVAAAVIKQPRCQVMLCFPAESVFFVILNQPGVLRLSL